MKCKTAKILDIVEEAKGEYYLIISDGTPEFHRWKISSSLVEKAHIATFQLVFKNR